MPEKGDDAEYVVLLDKRNGEVKHVLALTWDGLMQSIEEYESRWGEIFNGHLTLLARGLTEGQAKAMVGLTKEEQ